MISSLIFLCAVPGFVHFKNYSGCSGFFMAACLAFVVGISHRQRRLLRTQACVWSFAAAVVSRVIVVACALGMAAMSGYCFYYAGFHGQKLDTHSQYLGGIAFFIATKWSVVLALRVEAARKASLSGVLELREPYAPLYGDGSSMA